MCPPGPCFSAKRAGRSERLLSWRQPASAPMSFETTVSAFAKALDDPSAATPPMTRGRMGAPDARRFAVYRNNVAVGLIGALEARYPVSRRIAGEDLFRAMARAFVRAHRPRSPVMIAYGGEFPEFVAACRWSSSHASPTWRGSRTPGSRPTMQKTQASRRLASSPRSTPIVCPARGSFSIPRRGSCASRPPPPPSGPRRRTRAIRSRSLKDMAKTRSSRVPTATSACASCRRLLMISRLRLREGATLIEAAAALERPRFRLRDPSGRTGRIRRRRLHRPRTIVMIADAARAAALAPSNPIAASPALSSGSFPRGSRCLSCG